jgi:5-formyltetrahydrofolate cyclo-ligase
MNTEKAALRQEIKDRTDAFPETYIKESDAGICQNLTQLPQYRQAGSVLLYYSMGREPDTLAIARETLRLGKTLAFPVSDASGIMHAHVVRDLDDMTPGRFGIIAPPPDSPVLPPEEIDLIIVPAMTFDVGGYRLGRGGGYYDRYLLTANNAYTAGLCRERLLLDSVPCESHDIPAAAVVTEQRVICAPAE